MGSVKIQCFYFEGPQEKFTQQFKKKILCPGLFLHIAPNFENNLHQLSIGRIALIQEISLCGLPALNNVCMLVEQRYEQGRNLLIKSLLPSTNIGQNFKGYFYITTSIDIKYSSHILHAKMELHSLFAQLKPL